MDRDNNSIDSIIEIIKKSREFTKCKKCACMQESLKSIKDAVTKNSQEGLLDLLNEVETSIQQLESAEYS